MAGGTPRHPAPDKPDRSTRRRNMGSRPSKPRPARGARAATAHLGRVTRRCQRRSRQRSRVGAAATTPPSPRRAGGRTPVPFQAGIAAAGEPATAARVDTWWRPKPARLPVFLPVRKGSAACGSDCRWRATRRLPSSASDPRQPCAHRRAAFNRFAAEHLPVGVVSGRLRERFFGDDHVVARASASTLGRPQPSSPPWRVLDHVCEATTMAERLGPRESRTRHSGAAQRPCGGYFMLGGEEDLHAC